MDQFKARPTIYKGIQMRSRLEARVAAWLDATGVIWTYEGTAYAGAAGQYLPDFQIHRPDRGPGTTPGAPLFLEVKGEIVDGDTWSRDLLAMKTVLDSHPRAVLLMGFALEMEQDGSVYAWNFPPNADLPVRDDDPRGEFMRWRSVQIVDPLTSLGFAPMCNHWRLPRWNE